MNIEEFVAYHEKLNDKEVEKNWSYADEFVFVEHYAWKHKIDFLALYNEVIWRAILWEIIVDENIWFIVASDYMYIDKSFLELLKKKKIKKDYLAISNEFDKLLQEYENNEKLWENWTNKKESCSK